MTRVPIRDDQGSDAPPTRWPEPGAAGTLERPLARCPRRELGRGVLYGAFLSFAAVAGILRLHGVDPFWHLAAGRWILEHRRVPRTDPFRFTHDGAPWVDHEWLFQVALGVAERLAGLSGVLALRVALVVALALAMLVGLRRLGASPAAAVLLGTAAILGARERFDLRPELVSLVALPLLLILLQELRQGPSWRPAATLALLTMVWINAHPGALAAPVLAGAFLLGTRIPGGRMLGDPASGNGEWTPTADDASTGASMPWRWVLGLPAVLVVCLLANPYGSAVLWVPIEISRALRGLPGFNPDWNPSWVAFRPSFWLALVALLALALLLARRGSRPDPATGLVTLALALLALLGARHQALFFIGGAFFAADCLVRAGRSAGIRGSSRLPAGHLALLGCVLGTLWCVLPPAEGPLRPRGIAPSFGWGIAPGLFPEAAVDRIAETPGIGRLYNDVAFGGYLLWRLFPPRQVFLDSRNEVAPELLRDVGRARQDERLWLALMERFAIDGALVRYDERPRRVVEADGRLTSRTPSALLFPTERYALVYWDDVSMLFLRRRPERDHELEGLEYRFVQPEDWRHTLLQAAFDPRFRDRALEELDRRSAREPTSLRALELQAALEALAAL